MFVCEALCYIKGNGKVLKKGAAIMTIEKMLSEIALINKKYETIYKSTGEYFDIFSITNTSTKEVAVCRVLYELLNPNGSHCQGDLYLRAFVKSVLGLSFSDDEYKNANVYREYPLFNNRRIDLAVEIKGKYFIPIEVKIYADDLYNQCYDYLKRAINADLYYLTLDGHSPAKDRAGDLKKCEDADENNPDYERVSCISFAADIINWLEECLQMPETIKLAPVREVLQQFIRTLKTITNQLGDEQMNEMVRMLSNSEENMRNAKAIVDVFEQCRSKMILKFFNAFHEKFNCTLDRVRIDWDYDENNGTSADITYMFDREATPGISVVFILNSNKHERFLHVGLCLKREGEQTRFGDIKVARELRAHYGIDGKETNGWYLCREDITFEGKLINFTDLDENYFKLFDPEKFERIVDSTVKQAHTFLEKFKQS